MTAGDLIREILRYRAQDGRRWTQGQIGDKVGKTQPTVGRWLEGSEPDGVTLDKLRALRDRVVASGSLINQGANTIKGKVFVKAGEAGSAPDLNDDLFDQASRIVDEQERHTGVRFSPRSHAKLVAITYARLLGEPEKE